MRLEPPKSCPKGVQEAAHRCFGAKTHHREARDPLQHSILDRFGDDFIEILGSFCIDRLRHFKAD